MAFTFRLMLAFFTVILLTALGSTGYSLFLTVQDVRQAASVKVHKAVLVMGEDCATIQKQNGELAKTLSQDKDLLNLYDKRDRGATAAFLKNVIEQRNLIGFITIADENGRVFYSSDTPGKFGSDLRSRSKGIDYVYERMGSWAGYASFSPNYVTLSYAIPFKVTSSVGGVVIVSQPLNSEFLIGEARKLEMLPHYINDIDLVLFRNDVGRIVEITSDLVAEKNPLIAEVNQQGAKVIPSPDNWMSKIFRTAPGFENAGRWWSPQYLSVKLDPSSSSIETVGIILLTTPITKISDKLVNNLVVYGGTAGTVLLIAVLIAASIGRSVTLPMKTLSQRVSDLAAQKPNPTQLEGASGDWLELSDRIDGAITSMRSTTQNLRQRLSKITQEVDERSEEAQTTNNQFDNLNKQVAEKAKQLAEMAKQLQNANRQAIANQHKLDAVLQSSTEGFLLLDQYGNTLFANPVFLNWSGHSEAELAGRHCFDLVKKPGESPDQDANSGRVFVKHGDDPGELINQFYPEGVVYHHGQPRTTEVLAHLQPVAGDDSSIQGYVMVLRDKSLRSEIAQLRSDVTSMLSESLRAPLVTAETSWASILRNAPDTMHPSVAQSLSELHDQYKHLLNIIDSLLMVYAGIMPTPVMARESFPVQRLIGDCLDEFAPLAREKQLHLDYKAAAGLANVTTNREAMKAILGQVLERMILVTSYGGRVRMEVMMKSGEIHISVRSSGPALPESEIADMFVGFTPGVHSQDSYSWRLSMYLAGNNVERLGGKIWAESQSGRGTSIIFTLPAT